MIFTISHALCALCYDLFNRWHCYTVKQNDLTWIITEKLILVWLKMNSSPGDPETSIRLTLDPQYSMDNFSMLLNNSHNSSTLIDPLLCGNITPEYEKVFVVWSARIFIFVIRLVPGTL